MTAKLILENLEFNDGTNIPLNENSITIFVGANNVGKTVALKNIYNLFHTRVIYKVTRKIISNGSIIKKGSGQEFINFLKNYRYVVNNSNDSDFKINMDGSPYDLETIEKTWTSQQSIFFGILFIKFLLTENRISYSNKRQLKNFHIEPPDHPIHVLFRSQELEEKLSEFFRQAFNLDLVVDRFSGIYVNLKVGERPRLSAGETLLSSSYLEKINKLPFLSDQGDGMRSFASILLEMVSGENLSLIIDEPEAFLHPPQAKLLGKVIGNYFLDRQIFISTHSSDFIKGVLESGNQNINIIRIKRNEELNTPSLLNNSDIKEIWKDPILRFSPIIDGLFHESVVVCEGDGDCRFFKALLESEYENDPRYYRISDTLLLPSHGKDKMPSIVKALKKISVPTFTICDFDIFNNKSPLKELVEAHSGDWNLVEKKWNIFYTQINQVKYQLDKEEVKKDILEALDLITTKTLDNSQVGKIKSKFQIETAWSNAKKMGIDFLSPGDSYSACSDVLSYLNSIGIFPLPVGELESFDKGIGRKNKSKWLDEVLQKNFKDPNTLKQAKEFVHELVDQMYKT